MPLGRKLEAHRYTVGIEKGKGMFDRGMKYFSRLPGIARFLASLCTAHHLYREVLYHVFCAIPGAGWHITYCNCNCTTIA